MLVTGATGQLGRLVVQELLRRGLSQIIALSSRDQVTLPAGVQLVRGNLVTGEGLDQAARSARMVIHCASNSADPAAIDLAGTRLLLEALRTFGHPPVHLVYISIVGVDRSPFPYYQAKAGVESLIRASGFPYSILRTTQFHGFIRYLLDNFPRVGTEIRVPAGLRFQSIDTGEVAGRLVDLACGEPAGLLPDMGGPDILTLEAMAQDYLAYQGEASLAWTHESNPRNDLFRSGVNLCPEHRVGHITWQQFLERELGRRSG